MCLLMSDSPDIMAERKSAEEAAREALYNDDSGLVIGVEYPNN